MVIAIDTHQQVTELTNDECEEKCRLCGRQQIVQFLLCFAFKSLRILRIVLLYILHIMALKVLTPSYNRTKSPGYMPP